MSIKTQFNVLAGLCICGAIALFAIKAPDANAMALLALGGTLTGRGKA